MGRIQLNTVQAAHKQSERLLQEEEARLKSTSPSLHPGSLPVEPRVAVGSSLIPPISERAALLKSVLDSLQSDEARLQYIKDHPELTSISPLSPHLPSVASSPSNSQPMTDAFDLLTKAISIGMSMAQAPQPSSPPASTQAIDALKILETFRDITDRNQESFKAIIDGVNKQHQDSQASMRDMLTTYQEKLADSQSKIIALQVEGIERDKDYLKDRLAETQAALNRPPSIPIEQFKQFIDTARDQGVPLSVSTAEQEAARSRTELDRMKLEHQHRVEERKLDIEEARETRRATAISGLSTMVSGVLGAQQLKRHKLSPAGEGVASRL